MNHRVSLLVFAGLSITATQTLAQTSQSQPRRPAKAGSPDELICKHEDQETGSRIAPHLVCGTRAEWAQRLQEDRDNTEHAQRISLEGSSH